MAFPYKTISKIGNFKFQVWWLLRIFRSSSTLKRIRNYYNQSLTWNLKCRKNQKICINFHKRELYGNGADSESPTGVSRKQKQSYSIHKWTTIKYHGDSGQQMWCFERNRALNWSRKQKLNHKNLHCTRKERLPKYHASELRWTRCTSYFWTETRAKTMRVSF